MRMRPSLLLTAGFAAASALVLAGCGSVGGGSAEPRIRVLAPAAATTTTCADGQPVDASLAPSGISTDAKNFPSNSTMAAIQKRGYLRVATSGDVVLWGATDPNTGNPQGYDVDLAAEIAKRLGVNPAKTVYTVIPYSQRQSVLKNDRVDLVAQQMTINCARWSGTAKTATAAANPAINLSIPYYTAGARFLVRSDSTVKTVADLKGQSVCGTVGSTSLATIAKAGVTPVEAPSAGQCLVKFEEGEVAAVVGDETTLAGFKDQNPRSKIVGTSLNPGQYGIGTRGFSSGETNFSETQADDFTRFVNAVLEQLRSDGTLTALYTKWMKPSVGGSAPVLPAPVYGRDTAGLKRAS